MNQKRLLEKQGAFYLAQPDWQNYEGLAKKFENVSIIEREIASSFKTEFIAGGTPDISSIVLAIRR